MTDRILPHQLKHSTRADSGKPSTEGVFHVLREPLEGLTYFQAQNAAATSLFWLQVLTTRANRERAK